MSYSFLWAIPLISWRTTGRSLMCRRCGCPSFSKGNYNLIKNQLVRILLDADFFLSDRRYLDYDSETGYHQYVLDVEKHYEME